MQLVWTQRVLMTAAVVAAVGLVAGGRTAAKDPLPTGAAAEQLKTDIAYLKAGLEAKKRNAVLPLKSTTMLIAINAQNQMSGADAAKMAGVRDQAVKVAEALAKPEVDWDAAAKAAAAMESATGDPKAEVKLVALHDFDTYELMTIFKPKNRGGRGLEQEVLKFTKSAADVKAAAEVANLTALIGQFTELMPPADATADNKQKWIGWSQEMQKTGKEAAEAAKSGEKAGLTKKFQALNDTCTNCHNVFRK